MKIKRMTITKARNDFFRLVRRGYLKKEVVVIEKGEIPVSYIVPANLSGVEKLLKERGERK
jgi:hypothetical protein